MDQGEPWLPQEVFLKKLGVLIQKKKKEKTFTLKVFVSCARRTLDVEEQSYLTALKL
jgi:hypothetical protein